MDESTRSLEEMKQTLGLLKKTLITEREQRKKVKSELSDLVKIVTEAEQNLKEKVKINQIFSIERINLESQDFEHQIKKVQLIENFNENSSSVALTADSTAVFILEQQNQKIQEDSNQLIKENEKITEKIKTIEEY